MSEETRTPSEQITDTVTAWPGVEAGHGRRGEWSFRVGSHEVGHLHGDHAAHFALAKELGTSLREHGKVVDHPVFPGKDAMAARRIESQEDVDEVIELMRTNYDRIVARYGLPSETPVRPAA
ncbi:MAG TPA: luciferase family protein [Solirubrobacterales bacterium]|nr:luciferase family protein [Solirubrobacterales bacterium]